MKNLITALLLALTFYANSQCTYVAIPNSPACGSTCNGIVTFSAFGGTPPYFVNISGGPSFAFNTSFAWTTACAGNYQFVANDANGACMFLGMFTVPSVTPFNASIVNSGSNTLCPGTSATLMASPTGNGYTYQWRRNGNAIGAANAPSYTATIAGSYDVIVTNGPCTSTASPVVLTQSLLPSINIFAAGPTSFCNPGSVLLQSSAINTTTYQWLHNGLPVSNLNSHLATLPGDYLCIAINSCGSMPSNTITVTVNDVPPQPGTIAGSVNGVCNSTKTYSIAVVPTATSYTWIPPTGASIMSGQGTTSVSVLFNNNYATKQLQVGAHNGCGPSTLRNKTISGAPATPGAISGPNSVCKKQLAIYSISNVAGASTYTWSVPPGAVIKNGQGTKTMKVRFGTVGGNISVVANNTCGTSGANSLAVAMPCRLSEEDELNQSTITVYPNPAADFINFESTGESEVVTITIYDVFGKFIFTGTINVTEPFDLKSYNNGMYVYQLVDGPSTTTGRFCIAR
ncbi:MAG: T9SS type A sorting domain-containing protein [Bacteroidetes bacterium]|nr:T9SS type A sorting domain-containing protein [Bacteroidota bacterium]